MAFKLEVLRNTTAYTISDGAPFSIDEADLGGASVRNIDQSGPFQHGSTHLGHRLASTVMTLRLFVKATSHSALDGYRDTLNKIFQPVDEIPCILKLTRDDGEIRYLDTWREGFLAIPLDKTTRPGFTHKAVVQLRASDPAWYNPDVEEESFDPPAGEWWLGFATIGSANVLTHVEAPTQGQLWNNSSSVTAGSPFTVAVRTTPSTADFRRMFDARPPAGDNSSIYTFDTSGENLVYTSGTVGDFAFGAMAAGTHNYFLVSQGTAINLYRDGVFVQQTAGTTYAIPGTAPASGTARWRSNSSGTATEPWPNALPYAAAYKIALNSTQLTSLSAAMDAAGSGGSAYSAPIVYVGDVDSYPVITLQGPIADPVITNTTTGDVLDFTGGTVGSVDTWIIDTRFGRKSALFGTTSVANYLSTDSDLATFRIAADPIAAGGTNIITVDSSDSGTAAIVTISYYNRYLSY